MGRRNERSSPRQGRPFSPILGRATELDAAEQLLLNEGVRLLTLLGIGGVGKTRLALEVADRLSHAFPDGAWFIDLSALRDPALIPFVIGSALGVRQVTGRRMLTQLAAELRERQLLLVLDNLEQVVAGATDLARLLESCPGLVLLATRRQPLYLRVERRLHLGPLALPDPRLSAAEQAAEPAPSVALFVERARAVQAQFALTEKNVVAVGELCTRLDGLPLAIELAAVRLSVLSPLALLARLEPRLPLLQCRLADTPERHHALRTTFSWSYDLLDDEDRRLFRGVAVFADSFSPASVRAIIQPEKSAAEVLDALQRLVDKSLVGVVWAASGEPRFRLLETVREFALEQLARTGDLELLQPRQTLHFLAVAEQTTPGPNEAEQLARLAEIDLEHANMLAILDWAVASSETHIELRLAGALGRFWWIRGYAGVGRGRLEAALERDCGGPSEARARALLWCALLALWDATLSVPNRSSRKQSSSVAASATSAELRGHSSSARTSRYFKSTSTRPLPRPPRGWRSPASQVTPGPGVSRSSTSD